MPPAGDAAQKLRKMFLQEARAACDGKVKAFVECSKAEGLMVIVRCREQNRAMNDCAQQLTDDKHWEEFRQRKIVRRRTAAAAALATRKRVWSDALELLR